MSKSQVDAIVFSPPFKTASEGAGITKRIRNGTAKMIDRFGQDHGSTTGLAGSVPVSKENIDSLPYGEVDAIVFSPPYAEARPCQDEEFYRKVRIGAKRDPNAPHHRGLKEGYGKDPSNVGNLSYGSTNSEIEDDQVENILFFKPTPGFKDFEQFFHPDSVTHPAKANLNMLRWIIEKFTKPGEVVVDPMAGTGSTGVMAAFLNRKSILIDLEQKFVDMTKKNVRRFRKACQFWRVKRPEIVAKQGDSRQLSEVLGKVDSIIFSPPYSEIGMSEKSQCFAKPPRPNDVRQYRRKTPITHYSKEDERQIGNLPHGKIDTIITSPPYVKETTKGSLEAEEGRVFQDKRKGRQGTEWEFSGQRVLKHPSPNNIANLPRGQIDAIVTSPPFSESDTAFHDQKDEWVAKKTRALEKVSKDPGNIASLRHGEIDAIITSPPYEEGIGHGGKRRTKILTRDKGIWLQGRGSYSKSKENIGESRGETYLSAMLKVYQECWKVLKKGGLMVIIIKNFIRNKKIVRLDLDTIKLCEAAGFRLFKRFKCFLGQQSFWRIIYHQKYPKVPKIKYEHILVFIKL